MKAKIYNQNGEEVKEISLPEEIFGFKINTGLLRQAYLAQKNNSRTAIAHTKERSDVRGGGRKPWKQKGTGRARAGSNRSPIWRGGGITFGPRKEHNFFQKINKRMKRQAILMALSSKAHSEELLVLDKLNLKEIKTKQAAEILKMLPIKGKALIAQSEKSEIIKKAFQNIPKTQTILANSLNVVDLLENKNLIITEKSLEVIKNTFIKAV